jgi:hypothetical protein
VRGSTLALSALTLLALLSVSWPVGAQRRADAMVGAPPRVDEMTAGSSSAPERLGAATQPASIPRLPDHPEWWMPLASAALPGAGQALLDQDRFVVYAAVEGAAWFRYATERRESVRQRRAYRALANSVARAWFSTSFPVGNFEYYERMHHYVESGVFDVDPTSATVDPEPDTLTFNGALWLLARRTFWVHPDSVPEPESAAFTNAREFYLERAVRPEFRWSWRNAQLEHDLYRRTIAESNEASRQAVQALGIVLANHVLSTIDAYVTLRLWNRQQEPRSVGVAATIPWAPLGRGRDGNRRR